MIKQVRYKVVELLAFLLLALHKQSMYYSISVAEMWSLGHMSSAYQQKSISRLAEHMTRIDHTWQSQ